MVAIRVLFWCLIFISIWLVLAGITTPLWLRVRKKLSTSRWDFLGDSLLFLAALTLTLILRERNIDSQLSHQFLYRTRVESLSQSFVQRLNENDKLQAILKKNYHNFGISSQESLQELHRYGLPFLPTPKLLGLARLRLLMVDSAIKDKNYGLCLTFLRQQPVTQENLFKYLDTLSDADLQLFFEIQYLSIITAMAEMQNMKLGGHDKTLPQSQLRAPELFPLAAVEKAMDFNEAFLLRQLLRFPQYLTPEKKCRVYAALLKTYVDLTPYQQQQLAPWIF